MWKDVSISWKDKTLNGHTAGTGEKLLLLLHGFSNDATLFHCFLPLQQEYTILSLNLPFHGESRWPEGAVFTTEDLCSCTNAILALFHKQQFALCGFSLGGRIALKITELMPQKIEKLVLMAPDGLAFNPFYYFATRNFIGRSIFRYTMNKPAILIRLLTLAKKKRWVNSNWCGFVLRNLGSAHYCQLVRNVWPATKQLIPDNKKVKALIKHHAIETELFMGKYDRIIPLKNGVSFAAGAHNIHLHVLDRGHWLFDPEAVKEILKSLLQKT